MADQRAKTQLFTNYRYALYASDVKFQPSNRPSGRFDEARQYFSNKHKMCGLKLEASVSYPGICVGLSRCYPGSISDLTIFVQRQDFHLQILQKSNEELLEEDNGEGWENYSHFWAVLVDKGYQGSQSFIRAIHPKKKTIRGNLTVEDSQRNIRVSSDRVLVENYFGRVSALWKISRSTYKWSETSYDSISRITFALTNFHVSLMSLHASDGEFYKSALAKYYSQGEYSVNIRTTTQANYRKRRAARLRTERLVHAQASVRHSTTIFEIVC
uniref:AlNc14C35G3133 protein n=1 Tax=Albugo laibachii Nc14 TaxID=890382 RepID=F0W8K7_9STRA|nr:AlNc14C35G3133 [Albugo laibachii Nc14]|eukprot:CCA17462.1 AlNc14C35G3133 [Albugo laibachii Nc14]